MPALLLLPLLLPLGLALGAWVVWRLVLTRPALPPPRAAPPLPAPAEEPPPAEPPPAVLRYPQRLERLEGELVEAHRVTQQQLQHLSLRGAELAAKVGREELAARYAADVAALDRRAAALRRAMGTVWRTRSILLIRARLALAARPRPDLEGLPEPGGLRPAQLDAALARTERAALDLRRFVTLLDTTQRALPGELPAPPLSAEVLPEQRAAVDQELAEAQAVLTRLHARLDRLADALDYSADRLRTQKLVAAAPLQLDLEPAAGHLLEEVGEALAQLTALSEAGERRLDSGADALAADIGPLERLALDAQAEADAGLELERLLRRADTGPLDSGR